MFKKFDGWDWTELADYFEIDGTEDDNELATEVRKKINHLVSVASGWECGDKYDEDEQCKKDIAAIREFVTCLIDGNVGYDKPIYEGLLKVENDSVFLQYVHLMLNFMWN